MVNVLVFIKYHSKERTYVADPNILSAYILVHIIRWVPWEADSEMKMNIQEFIRKCPWDEHL